MNTRISRPGLNNCTHNISHRRRSETQPLVHVHKLLNLSPLTGVLPEKSTQLGLHHLFIIRRGALVALSPSVPLQQQPVGSGKLHHAQIRLQLTAQSFLPFRNAIATVRGSLVGGKKE